VVQTDFKPKNIDSSFARMDAIGDMFNFFIEREMRMRLGMSAAIWGSGIAIESKIYQEVQYSDFLGGFDKKLQSYLVQRVDRIAFAPEAILYDEKVTTGKSLEKQRPRWINAYFKYFAETLSIFLKGIRKASLNLVFFGFITLRPPLFIVIACALIFSVFNFFFNQQMFFIWLAVLFSFCLSFALIVLIKGKSLSYLKTLFSLPIFFFRQVLALLKMGKAKKSFMRTQHTKLIFIEDLVKDPNEHLG
jgi:cellulose synthase/poly-beta-1,6-N-acetylglucosamine synthase-like glycosyltransferase